MPTPYPIKPRPQSSSGFALVVALSLMAFVLLLLLSITTLLQVESQASQIQIQRVGAKQAALLGLQVALGELQKVAGPDQRVTALADILSNDSAKEPSAGRERWVGVWDTNGYSPVDPDAQTFKRWLVSSSAANGLVSDEDANKATLASSLEHIIFDAVNASGAGDTVNDVIVEKIPFSSAVSGNENFYAYWVEDEGVKADMAWNEGAFADQARAQIARFSAVPGVDYGVFADDTSSPFNGQLAYPIKDNSWFANLSKMVSTADLPLVTEKNVDAANWLRAFHHDITFGSRAVLSDVRNGGLRRDLSLAFEMDGTAESEDATLF